MPQDDIAIGSENYTGFYDIALRDVGLLLAALTLARAWHPWYDPAWRSHATE